MGSSLPPKLPRFPLPKGPQNRRINDEPHFGLVLFVALGIALATGTFAYIVIKPKHEADVRCHESGGIMVSTSKGRKCFRDLDYE